MKAPPVCGFASLPWATLVAREDSLPAHLWSRVIRCAEDVEQASGIEMPWSAVNTEIPNAFTDGERGWVTKGLVELLDDAELTWILGHETGHKHSRHVQRTIRFRQAWSEELRGMAASAKSPTKKVFSLTWRFLLYDLVIDPHLRRSKEMIADVFGRRVLESRGLRLDAAVSALRKLAPHMREGTDFFASHPVVLKRIAIMENPRKFYTTW